MSALTWTERPETCPACGAEKYPESYSKFVGFECGMSLVDQGSYWHSVASCSNAVAVSIALRAERDALLMALSNIKIVDRLVIGDPAP